MRFTRAATIGLLGLATGGLPRGQSVTSERVFSESPPVWFEGHRIAATIGADGKRAAMPLRWPNTARVIDLATGRSDSTRAAWPGVDSVRNATFTHRGALVVLGWRGGEYGWFALESGTPQKLGVPTNATPRWSASGHVAYFVPYARTGEPGHALFVGEGADAKRIEVDGRLTGLAWLPSGDALLALTCDDQGASTLHRIDHGSGTRSVIARNLDADPSSSPVAVSPDGRTAFVALSSPNAVSPAERHRPDVDRDQDVYAIDLATGAKRVVVATPHEEHAPAVAGDDLYWTHTEVDMAVVTLPADGGVPVPVVAGAFLPSWGPAGRELGFVYGGFRGPDWVLNWEGGAVDVDATGRATASSPRAVIAGLHEDFQPVWSPNGRWIAYHSHRSSAPVVLYATPETTDDIYLRRAGSDREIRLTDYGWEVGSPEWSRDGTRLLFTGWMKNVSPLKSYAGIVTIDTATGAPISHTRIPLGPITGAEMASWSPVSNEIAIEEQVRPGRHALWIIGSDGSRPRKLIEYGSFTYGGVDWSQDGRTLIYSALVDGRMQLFSIAVSGGTPRQLTRENANVIHPQLSPDGRLVAATRVAHRKEIRRTKLPMPNAISAQGIERVEANDNRRPGGSLEKGVLTLALEARLGMWHPDGDSAAGAAVPAFAEPGRAPQIPGPLVRVPAGTDVIVTVKNSVPDATLTMYGLHPRPAPASARSDTVQVAPGATREVRFRVDAPGTYFYWGTTEGRPFVARTREDAQLSGAIVVDDAGSGSPPRDRVLVIGMWADTVGSEALRQRNKLLFVVNGRSWPHTERFSYDVGDTLRWRVINTSADIHPMHLHGFYFAVGSRGDGTVDSVFPPSRRDLVNTERMPPRATMTMSWTPERAGNWLFHCHFPEHIAPRGSLGEPRAPARPHATTGHSVNHALEGMNGLVVGMHVNPRRESARSEQSGTARRRIRLLVRSNAGGSESLPYYGFALHERGTEPAPDSGHRTGPDLVLTRGEPVSVWVVNRTPEPTAVHWHGIELESYFDGVAGFSGAGRRLAPVIAPRDSFEARFTPPRAGTFIYHSHVDEVRQQRAGLVGALIVREPGQRVDAATDLTVLISSPSDPEVESRAVLLNGSVAPPTLELRRGVLHRIRFINITTARPGMRMELRQDTSFASWRLIAKDGADLAEAQRAARPARLPISIGETFDVELTPTAAGALRLEARTTNGALLAAMPVRVR